MIKEINIQNFRNHDQKNINFTKNINVFLGDNGSGKTGILEAIFYAIENTSFRTKNYQDLIKNNTDLAKVSLKFLDFEKLEKNLDIELKINSKKSLLNGIEKNKVSNQFISIPIFINNKLINNFKFDKLARQTLVNNLIKIDHKIYGKILSDFDKLYSSLNEINSSIVINKGLKKEVISSLYDLQKEIIFFRNNSVSKLNDFFTKNCKKYLKKDLYVKYKNAVEDEKMLSSLLLNPPSTIKKDDFLVKSENRNYLSYASDGQTKMIILLMILSFIEYLKSEYDLEFVFLLDDVFSELDKKNSNLLIEILTAKKINCFITSPRLKLEEKYQKKVQVFKI